MRHPKRLVVAAAAMGALTASLGAGAASATELCGNTTTPCTGTKYLSGTNFHATLESGTLATYTNSIENIHCDGATFAGKTTSSGGGGAVSAEITGFTLTSCDTVLGTACTAATATNLPWSASISEGGAAVGATFRLAMSDEAKVAFDFKCGMLIDCTFFTFEAIFGGTNIGTGTPTVLGNMVLNKDGPFCPKTAGLDVRFLIDSPDPLYVV